MPSSTGRARMPHNNRMSTSATLKTTNIWQSTIGHDPYGNNDDPNQKNKARLDEEKAKTLLKLANASSAASSGRKEGVELSNGFVAQMYSGLKTTKKRTKVEALEGPDGINNREKLSMDAKRRLEEEDSSSSEDEFIEVVQRQEDVDRQDRKKNDQKKKKKKKKRSRKKKRHDSEVSDSSDDDDDDDRKKRKGSRKKSRRKHYSSSSNSDSQSSDESDFDRKKRGNSKIHKRRARSNSE
jgi:hypothetical protein